MFFLRTCGDVYIGQTRLNISSRLHEHKQALKKLDENKSEQQILSKTWATVLAKNKENITPKE